MLSNDQTNSLLLSLEYSFSFALLRDSLYFSWVLIFLFLLVAWWLVKPFWRIESELYSDSVSTVVSLFIGSSFYWLLFETSLFNDRLWLLSLVNFILFCNRVSWEVSTLKTSWAWVFSDSFIKAFDGFRKYV